jgi:hypothetical protein
MIEYKDFGGYNVKGPISHTDKLIVHPKPPFIGMSVIIRGIFGFDTRTELDGRWMVEKELLEYKAFKINKYKEKIETLTADREWPEQFPLQSFMSMAEKNLEYWNNVKIQYEEMNYAPERVPCPNPF